MGAITSAVIAIAGVIVGWITIEFACKPCLDKGREAIDRSLNPDYDPDDDVIDVRAPLISNPTPPHAHILHSDPHAATSSAAPPPEEIKAV